jgi:hypothetical protein
MNRMRIFLKNINPLNIMLIAVVVFMANYAVLPLLNMKITYTLAAHKKIADVTSKDKGDESVEGKNPSAMDYTIIADQNLFHPERIIPPEKKEEAALPKPEFVLYGTLITDDLSLAYMEDKKALRTTAGRGNRQTVMKKGNTLSGFTLKEIDPDKVVMVRGEETLVVKVMDSSAKKQREVAGTSTTAPPMRVTPGGQNVQMPPVPSPANRQPRRVQMPSSRPQSLKPSPGLPQN